VSSLGLVLCVAAQVYAGTIVQTGPVTNSIAVASRPGSPGSVEIEAADDFLATTPVALTSGTFTGLLVGLTPPTINGVDLEIYRVFPLDSDNVRTPNVVTRANSPSDVAFASYALTTDFNLTATLLASTFTANNSVQAGGIHAKPSQTTGGQGAVTGQEVEFDFTFILPEFLPAGHYFFVPQVQTTGGDFFWLSGTRPLVTLPFTPDLQGWIRDANLDPDWSRIGTDIIGGTPPPTYNLAFSLNANVIPEPSTLGLCLGALVLLCSARTRACRVDTRVDTVASRSE
jgi:hypothetical protein